VTGIKLTRAEEAYAQLAAFQHGDKVEVDGRAAPRFSGTVTTVQQHDHSDINRVFLVVTSDDGTFSAKVTVGLLLAGLTISLKTCEMDWHTYDTYDNERYWHCDEPGAVDVDGVLMCSRHAGQLGYGPMQAEYGFDPDDGLNPTAAEG
jgi:hypothetical protein